MPGDQCCKTENVLRPVFSDKWCLQTSVLRDIRSLDIICLQTLVSEQMSSNDQSHLPIVVLILIMSSERYLKTLLIWRLWSANIIGLKIMRWLKSDRLRGKGIRIESSNREEDKVKRIPFSNKDDAVEFTRKRESTMRRKPRRNSSREGNQTCWKRQISWHVYATQILHWLFAGMIDITLIDRLIMSDVLPLCQKLYVFIWDIDRMRI